MKKLTERELLDIVFFVPPSNGTFKAGVYEFIRIAWGASLNLHTCTDVVETLKNVWLSL